MRRRGQLPLRARPHTRGGVAYVTEFFDGFELEVTDLAPGALPGLDRPAARAFVDAVGGEVAPKFGWTDVARFSALGVPAVNYGPGDPLFAHKQDEHVPVADIVRCEEQLRAWLEGGRMRDQFKGPVRMRRQQVENTTTDQRLLDSRGPSDWVHTDPWRVMKITAEFVEGFNALAELGPAIAVFGSARTAPEHRYYALAEQLGRGWPRPASR